MKKNRWIHIVVAVLIAMFTATPGYSQGMEDDYWDGMWSVGYLDNTYNDDWYYDYYEPDYYEDAWYDDGDNDSEYEWDYDYWESEWEYEEDDWF